MVSTLLVALSSAQAQEGARFETSEGGGLVLTHTSVHATVEVGLAVVEVTQQFQNPYDHPIDATYLFPLPKDAAVQEMAFTCGTRRLVGELLTRDAARKRYEAAAAEGRKAALLEQERANLFRQSVSALCPGETVTVELTYLDPLTVEDGRTELVFPTTVGPLFRPEGTPQPPFTTLPAHALEVSVELLEGMPVESVWSDSHEIDVTDEGAWGATVWNSPDDALPNKDFHLAWTLAGATPQLSALAVPPTADSLGYVAVTIEPQVVEDLEELRPRELIFVIDESCSMSGAPFEAARETVRRALREMRPEDRFDLVRFSNEASALFEAPAPATAANVAAAEAWLEVFDGQGTQMTRGVVKSLTLPHDPARLKLVLFVTDGYIGNDGEVLRAVEDHLGEARIFSLGVGSSVNRGLLEGLAEVGRGDVIYQLPETPVAEVVDTFYDRIAHPALSDLSLDWGGLDVVDVYPARLPDVFAGQPVRVVARFRGEAVDTDVVLRGSTGTESLELRRPLHLSEAEAHPGLPAVWARRKIAWLERDAQLHGGDPEAAVTAVALSHHLVSTYTSLVATEKTRSSCGPTTSLVDVPSMMPDGVVMGGLLGASGLGVGGGGTGMGISGLGTRGAGSSSVGYGKGGGDFGAKAEGGIGTVGGDPIILGALDRSLIDAVIQRHMNQVRYCYQRELTRNPALGGKVVMKFVIGPDGTVSTAEVKTSTLGNAAVESCLVGRFLRMQFPTPSGSGNVVVSYPFVFAPN
jgi:Ca-activated chloride channel family protein